MTRTGKMVESAMMVAMAFILEVIFKFIPILQMPMGGSFSLAMLPIVILGLHLGWQYGLLGGICFGLLNFVYDGYAFNYLSLILDYILPFGVIGLSGLFKKQANKSWKSFAVFGTISLVVFGTVRFISHVISGMVAFETPFWGSCVYNFGYCYASICGCIAVLWLISKGIFKVIETRKA